jgi:hypothetical protein
MLSTRVWNISAASALIAALGAAGPAPAGPPYLSDDPEPTDPGRWEIYNFAIGTSAPSGLSGEAGLDLNYGAADDLQLTAVLPVAFEDQRGFGGRGLRGGPADLELAAKFRVLRQADGALTPDLAFFPRLFAPTAPRSFGDGRFGLLLPIWAEKDFGPWSMFGGGGYQFNPGPGQRDFWQGGVAVAKSLGERLSLGVEVYGQTRNLSDAGAFAAVNLAATYKLVKHWSLLASAGPMWTPKTLNGAAFYLALKADY